MPNFIIEVALEGIDKLSPLLERAARLVDHASQSMERSLQGVQRQLDAVAASADRNFAQVGKDMEEVGRELEATGRKLRPLGIALAATGAAMVAPAVVGTKRYAEFQAQMQAVRAVAELTDAEFAQLGQTAQVLGAETPFTALEAAEGLTVLARAGFNTREMLDSIGPLLQLAGAGGIELADAANITVRAMRGMGLQTAEAQRVVDVLAKAANSSTADVGDLGEGFSYVAAVARQAGISLEETASALAILSDGGIVASKAGTGLQAVLREMTAPSPQQRRLMQQLGLSFFDAAGNVKPLADIVQQLNDKLGPMGAKARLGALNILFLDQGARTMSVLMGQGANKIRELEASLDSANGEALRMQQERLKGLAGSWELFLGELDVALQFIGKLFEPTLTFLVKALERVVAAFNRLPGPVKAMVALLTTLMGGLLLLSGAAILVLGPLGALWASMGVGLTKVGMLTAGLGKLAVMLLARVIPAIVSTMVAMGPIGWILLAIAAVVALFAFAWMKNLFGIREKVAAFVDFIKKHWQGILLMALLGPIGVLIFVARRWRSILGMMGNAFQWFGGVIAAVVDFLKSLPGKALEIGKAIPGMLLAGIKAGVGMLLSGLKSIGKWVFENFKIGLGDLWGNSPSMAGIKIGVDLITGIREGLRRTRIIVDSTVGMLSAGQADGFRALPVAAGGAAMVVNGPLVAINNPVLNGAMDAYALGEKVSDILRVRLGLGGA